MGPAGKTRGEKMSDVKSPEDQLSCAIQQRRSTGETEAPLSPPPALLQALSAVLRCSPNN